MRRLKPRANPSMLVTINKWFDRGLITEEERIRLRKQALSTNVYTGKGKANGSSRQSPSRYSGLSFESAMFNNNNAK